MNVTAIDFVPENIEFVHSAITNILGKVTVHQMDITEPWPFADNSFGYAYDAFCFKHVIETEKREYYIAEISRVLKPGQYFAISLADIEDGYYGQFLTNDAPLAGWIMDPGNQIPSILYSYESFCALFNSHFTVAQYQLKTSVSEMYGKSYNRRIHQFILQNRK
jgi:SAM-dependent methyltransferase